jgi:hypothetical protein
VPFRYVAQRVLTGAILDQDLDLVPDGPPQRELSGPGSFSGSLPLQEDPTIAPDGQPILDDWSTAIYAEQNGRIQWGGLVTDSKPAGDRLAVTCAGFTAYPIGQPYLGVFGRRGAEDVFDIVRAIWSHLQGYPRGKLGMVLDGHKCGVAIGNVAEPFGMVWWEPLDCGNQINQLAESTPFDYIEQHSWTDSSRTAISHRLRLGYPRLGAKRDDLRFAAGENIAGDPAPDRLEDDYSNEIFGVGKGEGYQSVKVSIAVNDRMRVRRCSFYTDKALKEPQLRPMLTRELARRRAEWGVESISVYDHPNAPIGSWSIGDDIPVTLDQPFLPRTTVWHRIVSDQMDSDRGVATLGLVRSDAYAL